MSQLLLDVRNHQEAATEPVGFRHLAISIRNPQEASVTLYPDPDRIATLELSFADVGSGAAFSFSIEQARAIIDTVEAYRDKIDGVMVHCDRGAARSHAVAMFLGWLWDGHHVRRTPGIPNPHIVTTLISAFRQ